MTRVGFIILSVFFLVECGPLRADVTNAALAKATLLESNVLYLRVNRIAAGLPEELAAARLALAGTNKIIGTALDLRFADGDDAGAAAATADLFAGKKLPLAILVNGGTRESAAALAAALRKSRAGLIFGSPAADLQPDILVALNIADERAYFADAYSDPGKTNLPAGDSQSTTNQVIVTNGTAYHRISEADLVRARREGAPDPEDDADKPSAPVPPEKPVLRDPAILRALDLLKGFALLRVAPSR